MRTPLIVGNWKMNKTVSEAIDMVKNLKQNLNDVTDREIVVCPPYTSLANVEEIIKNSNIFLGAQNVFWEEKGAYTGEISPGMLKEIGCKYVIIGHSERRHYFNETDYIVNKKLKAVFNSNMVPIVCVGETLDEREKNLTFKIIENQIRKGLEKLNQQEAQKIVIAYEPVWAIGTGKTATPQQAQEVHQFIRELYSSIYGNNAEFIRILYGGSIKPDNFSDLMKQKDIDGGLVGGASLEVNSFTKIVKYN